MSVGLHDVSDDGFLAQLLARLQTMQPLHQDETFAVLPHQDWALQADLEDALGDLLRLLGIERRAPFHRHDVIRLTYTSLPRQRVKEIR
jgi:hypothetical protein